MLSGGKIGKVGCNLHIPRLFEAAPEAQLEFHTNRFASAVLADTICCEHLQVQEQQ